MHKTIDPEMQAFQDDLEAVRDMKAGRAARITEVKQRPAAADSARALVCLNRSSRTLLGVSVRTLQNWEQGRSSPSGAAQTLIRVAI